MDLETLLTEMTDDDWIMYARMLENCGTTQKDIRDACLRLAPERGICACVARPVMEHAEKAFKKACILKKH